MNMSNVCVLANGYLIRRHNYYLILRQNDLELFSLG